MEIEIILKIITALIAIIGLIFGIIRFVHIQEIEASKPFLEKKLEWCIEATETASSIANAKGSTETEEKRFWELYWGVMGMVENEEITKAMIAFGKELKARQNLQKKSLDLAHACRTEMANDWSSSWKR